MPSSHSASHLSAIFDDDHCVANAGVVLVEALTETLGLDALCPDFRR